MGTNVNISGATSGFCSESDISINPSNPDQIICASNATLNQAQFWSGDGGATWQQTLLPLDPADLNQTDPAINWTSDGTAWSTTIGLGMPDWKTRVYSSPDGGATWAIESTPSGTQTANDRQTLWVDHNPSSPHHDNMYMIWHDGLPAYVVSRQGPGGTWSAPKQVSAGETTGATTGATLTTNAQGHVFAIWPDDGSLKIYFAKSTDGGGSFSTPAKVADLFAGYKVPIPAQDLRQAAIYVSAGTSSAAGLDLVYVVWTNLAGGGGCSTAADAPGSNVASSCKTRIWFARSTNGGTNWDPAVKINDQNSLNDQFFPRLVVDDATGDVAVVYYDTVGDPGRLKADIWLQTSLDNGASWSGAMKITEGETDETNSASDVYQDQFGDYIGMSSAGGTMFACWTDRHLGGDEQIWGAPVAVPACELIVDKSTFGQDEVAAQASYPSAFWLAVDGFPNKALGFAVSSDLSSPPNPAPVITATIDAALNPTLSTMQIMTIGNNLPTVNTFGPEPILAEDPTLQLPLQRYMYPYTISFPNTAAFAALNQHQAAVLTLHASLTVGLVTVRSTALIELAKGEDPYLTDVNPADPTTFPFWLSYDMRVFKVTPNQTHQWFSVPNPTDASGAVAYIQAVIHNLNTPGTIMNGDTFESLSQAEEGVSALEFLPKDKNGDLTFNFALARVRILGNTATTVGPVRVFFRLFQAQSTNSDFNENTTYRWGTDGVTADHKIPLLGVQNDQHGNPEYVTIPCFAADRINLVTPTDMHKQHDDTNAQPITTVPGVEVDTYYGCWLDVNQPGQTFLIPTPPADPTKWDGPWPGTQSISGAITVAPHQCVIAEIRFDDTPVPPGATSATSDKLAQRNIGWIDGPNPGTAPSRVMSHPFEVRASGAAHEPDELMITWGRTPAGSTATLYLPEVNAADVLTLARAMYTSHRLTAVDAHTIACPAEGTTFVPVPKGEGRYAGLLSVNVPAGVRRGDTYDIVVRQITDAADFATAPPPVTSGPQLQAAPIQKTPQYEWRRTLAAFQITIKISTKEQLLYPEERLLAWLKWRLEVMPPANRWRPVLLRYLDVVAGRVGSFGGNPNAIPPSPEGDVPGHVPEPHGHPFRCYREYCGKVAALFYDRFGDFEGFLLETESGHEHWFRGREREIEALANRAWCERIAVSVFVDEETPDCPVSIVLRRAGELCREVPSEREECAEKSGHEHGEHESPLEKAEHFAKRLLFGEKREPEKHDSDE